MGPRPYPCPLNIHSEATTLPAGEGLDGGPAPLGAEVESGGTRWLAQAPTRITPSENQTPNLDSR